MPTFTPRNMAIAAGAVGAAVFFFPRTAQKVSPMENVFETPGVKNVGNRMSAGGGSNNHTPAVATPRGNPDNVNQNQETPKGVSTPHFDEHQASQKVDTGNHVPEAFRRAHLGNDKGK